MRERLKVLHAESGGTYGSPRMLKALQNEGVRVSKRRIERALRSMGMQGRQRRRWRITTRANPAHPVVDNALARDFTASGPNEKWVTDISYMWTDEGWCYLATVLNLFSRAVVGWSLDTTLSTRLPLAAGESEQLNVRTKKNLGVVVLGVLASLASWRLRKGWRVRMTLLDRV